MGSVCYIRVDGGSARCCITLVPSGPARYVSTTAGPPSDTGSVEAAGPPGVVTIEGKLGPPGVTETLRLRPAGLPIVAGIILIVAGPRGTVSPLAPIVGRFYEAARGCN